MRATIAFNSTENSVLSITRSSIDLVLYGDFQCVYCADVYPVIRQLQREVGMKLHVTYRHFALRGVHPLSLNAAIAAEASGLQDKFWGMHDMIFENQKYLTRASFGFFAEALKLDVNKFESDRNCRKLFNKVSNDYETGIRQGVDCTPTIFINGIRYNGFDDYRSLQNMCMNTCASKINVC